MGGGLGVNIMAKIPSLLCFLTLLLFLNACTNEDSLDCAVSDQIKFLSDFSIGDKSYYLYERRSGFSEKISYLEFYDLKPDFDQCGEPSKPQLSQVPVSDLGNNPVKIVIQDLLIDVEYGDKPYSSPDLSLLPVEIR